MPQTVALGDELGVLRGVRGDAVDVVDHCPQVLAAAGRLLAALTRLGEGTLPGADVPAQGIELLGGAHGLRADEPVEDLQLRGR